MARDSRETTLMTAMMMISQGGLSRRTQVVMMIISLGIKDMIVTVMKKRGKKKAKNIWSQDLHHQMMKMSYSNRGSDKRSCKRMLSST